MGSIFIYVVAGRSDLRPQFNCMKQLINPQFTLEGVDNKYLPKSELIFVSSYM